MSTEGHDDYGMAVEPEEFNVRRVFRAGLMLFGGIAVALPFVLQIMNRSVQQAEFDASANYQAFPAIHEAEVAGERKTTQFEVIDATSGVYQIPVDRAMELLVEQGRDSTATTSTELPERQ